MWKTVLAVIQINFGLFRVLKGIVGTLWQLAISKTLYFNAFYVLSRVFRQDLDERKSFMPLALYSLPITYNLRCLGMIKGAENYFSCEQGKGTVS